MKTFKTITPIIAAVAAVVSLAATGAVWAQPGQGMGPGMGMGPGAAGRMHGPQTPAASAAHLAELKAQLKITAAQEPAWQKFEAFVAQQAQARESMRTAMQAQMNDPKATPADHAAHREAMGKAREGHRAEHDAARQELLAVLTPEQKLIAERHMSAGPRHHMAQHAPQK